MKIRVLLIGKLDSTVQAMKGLIQDESVTVVGRRPAAPRRWIQSTTSRLILS